LDPDQATAPQLATVEHLVADPALVQHHLAQLPRLRWLQSTWAGVECVLDKVPVAAAAAAALCGSLWLPRMCVCVCVCVSSMCVCVCVCWAQLEAPPPWRMTRFAGYFGPPMSQYVMAHILAHLQRLPDHARHQASPLPKDKRTGLGSTLSCPPRNTGFMPALILHGGRSRPAHTGRRHCGDRRAIARLARSEWPSWAWAALAGRWPRPAKRWECKWLAWCAASHRLPLKVPAWDGPSRRPSGS
jgi:hypothetical protein